MQWRPHPRPYPSSTVLELMRAGAPATSPSRTGSAALGAVRRGLLTRAAERRRLRLETIPALWPMTRHLVRRVGEQLVREGLLERGPNDVVRITDAGLQELLGERRH